MKKLQQLKAKQAETKNAPTTTAPTTSNTSTGNVAIKRSTSKELVEKRKNKSKDSVFNLRNSGKKKAEKTESAVLRVQKDWTEYVDQPGIKVEFPDPNDLLNFFCVITPADGYWVGGKFRFKVTVPKTFPYDPPVCECKTPVYHPNIDTEGKVCLNILRAEWSPVLSLGLVAFGLLTLFLQPNADDPLGDPQCKKAADLLYSNKQTFANNVKKSLSGGNVEGRNFLKNSDYHK